MRRSRWLVGFWATALLWLPLPSPAEEPVVLLLGLGAIRADRAQQAEIVPTLRWLVRQGVEFTTAYANAPWPRAAAATVLTGTLSHGHGVRGPLDGLSPQRTTLAQAASAEGYDTVAVVSHLDLDPAAGFGRGFDRFDARLSLPLLDLAPRSLPVPDLFFGDLARDRSVRAAKIRAQGRRTDADTTEAALGMLAKHRRRPLFLWVSYFGASQTFSEEGVTLLSADAYAQRLRALDEEVRRLLDGVQKLGLAARTLLIVYGDSGFSLLEHGDYGAGTTLYEPAVRIPLAFIWPQRIPAGRTVEEPVSLVDVAPTVADLLGWRRRTASAGRSLAPLLFGAQGTAQWERRPVLLETYLPATAVASREVRTADGATRRAGSVLRAVRWGPYKLIARTPHPLIDVPSQRFAAGDSGLLPAAPVQRELYDLRSDPGELRDLVSEQPAVLEELDRWLREFEAFGEKKVP